MGYLIIIQKSKFFQIVALLIILLSQIRSRWVSVYVVNLLKKRGYRELKAKWHIGNLKNGSNFIKNIAILALRFNILYGSNVNYFYNVVYMSFQHVLKTNVDYNKDRKKVVLNNK